LQSSLSASRSHLSRLVSQKCLTGQLIQTNYREEYKNVLTAAQDSAAVQLLLEACLETEGDRVCFVNTKYLHIKSVYIIFYKIMVVNGDQNWLSPCILIPKSISITILTGEGNYSALTYQYNIHSNNYIPLDSLIKSISGINVMVYNVILNRR